ncbi:MAG: hypothetical protein JXR53_11365 [Bacteroidales bacterium]|nr:hypothetical protein [Bacteroidales bacterium]
MVRIFLIIFLSFVLSSCTTIYLITVKQDGSAIADVGVDYDLSIIEKHYQSDIISEVDTFSQIRESFEINMIDSLGNYLPFLPIGFFQFNMNGDTLIITGGHTIPSRGEDKLCCNIDMLLTFEQEIDLISKQGGHVKKQSKNSVFISIPRRKILKEKENLGVVILLK